MYLIAIAWLYVALMMAVAEATHAQGTVTGAILTFVLYGVAPVSLLMHLLGRPGRRRARLAREAREQAAQAAVSADPDAGSEAPADPVAPVRKEP